MRRACMSSRTIRAGTDLVKFPIAISLICATTAAHAMQAPVPATIGGDPHVQVARYDPTNPILLVGTLGRAVTLTFSQSEWISAIHLDAGYIDSDSKKVDAPWEGPDPEALAKAPPNVVPIWAMRTGRSSGQIITRREDGTFRTYQFVLVALPPQPDECSPLTSAPDMTLDCDDVRIAYSLSFTYPPEKPKPADPVVAQAAQAERVAKVHYLQAQQKLSAEARLKTDFFYGERNWKYVGKGEKADQAALIPDQVSDNASVTGMRFLGNRKVPAIYIVDPDGTERQVTPTPEQDVLVIQETARHWRLRAGSQVADLYNVGYDSIGANPETGTTSPEVVRVTREASKK